MGLTWQEYARKIVTPFNVFAALVLLIGLPLIAMRFIFGLESVTHGSHDYPWGLFLGWGLFGGVPLSATGFVIGSAYYIFGFKGMKPIVRLALLVGLLGYFFSVVYLLIDLGRPWRIYYPMAISFGTVSVLFLVAWHVAVYLMVQLVEFSPVILKWLNANRFRKWAVLLTISMTIAGIILSTLHQSALGAMFLIIPSKLHPLWYSPYIPVFYLAQSIYAALCMMIVVTSVVYTWYRNRCGTTFLNRYNHVTRNLAMASSVAIYIYVALKIIGLVHGDVWWMLDSPYGYWYLVELIGLTLLPGIILTLGYKVSSNGALRIGAIFALIGIMVNRLNVTLVAFNYNRPDHLWNIIPTWQEIVIVLTITILHILVLRWIIGRMPVLSDD